MKKIFLGFGILISILLVLVGFNAYDRDEAAVKRMMEKLVSALEKDSVEEMRSLFAPFVVESTNKDGRLDDDIAYILQYISDDISQSSYKAIRTSDYISGDGYKKDVYCTYLLETPGETYKVHVVMRTSAWGVYKGKGILLMEVWSESDIERTITTNNLDNFHFRNSEGFMGIWYPTEDAEGNMTVDGEVVEDIEETDPAETSDEEETVISK